MVNIQLIDEILGGKRGVKGKAKNKAKASVKDTAKKNEKKTNKGVRIKKKAKVISKKVFSKGAVKPKKAVSLKNKQSSKPSFNEICDDSEKLSSVSKSNLICPPEVKRKRWAARENIILVNKGKGGRGKWASISAKDKKNASDKSIVDGGIIGSNQVKTIFDRMYSIVSVRKSVSVADLSKSLAVKESDVLELARVFEESGRMKIFYPLMGNPRIVFSEKGDLE